MFGGRPYTVYVTDYSTNTSLYAYQWYPHTDWPGPFGKHTLQIGCWDNIEYQAQECRVGEIYHFRNVNGRRFDNLLHASAYGLETRTPTLKAISTPIGQWKIKSLSKRIQAFLSKLTEFLDPTTIDRQSERPSRSFKRRKRSTILVYKLPSRNTKRSTESYGNGFERNFHLTIKLPPIRHHNGQVNPSETEKEDESQSKQKSLPPNYPTTVPFSTYQYDIDKCLVIAIEGANIPPVTIEQIMSTNTASLKPRKFRLECRVHAFHPSSLADFAAAWCGICKNTFIPLPPHHHL